MHSTVQRLALPLAAAATLASASVAQSTERTLPRGAHDAWGNGNFQKNAATAQFTIQNWYSGHHLPVGTVISAIALRGRRNRASDAFTADTQVRLENTHLDVTQLNTTLANNMSSNAVVAFARRQRSVPALPAPTSPSDARGQWIVFDQPFVFTGPNLIIEIDERNRVTTGTQLFDGMIMVAPTLHRKANHPVCGAALNALYANGEYQLALSGAQPNQPAFFWIGTENSSFQGGRLPFDLTSLGAPGCFLGVLPIVSVPAVSNPFGSAGIRIPVSLPVASLNLSAQAVHPDANQSTVFSNTVHSMLGDRASWNQVPSFDGVTAIAGYPSARNSGPVLLIR